MGSIVVHVTLTLAQHFKCVRPKLLPGSPGFTVPKNTLTFVVLSGTQKKFNLEVVRNRLFSSIRTRLQSLTTHTFLPSNVLGSSHLIMTWSYDVIGDFMTS